MAKRLHGCSEFVITDSFHACVFSIIFNKPFIDYSNASRGASRFHSLLAMFGLQDRFISSSEELNNQINEIAWEQVNQQHTDFKTICNSALLDLQHK